MTRELVIYCDESTKKGKYFSNFYGGCLVRSEHLDHCRSVMEKTKASLGFDKEVKWRRVTENYLQRYVDLVEKFFDLIEDDLIKIRIMFTQNMRVPTGLSPEQRRNEYFLLYYQFLKHAFGLRYANDAGSPIRLRIYPDQLPDSKEKIREFKSFLARLNFDSGFKEARININSQDIAEVDSAKHVLLQCLDIVLGAMQFRLNDLHKEKAQGSRFRGRRTRAKEKLYKTILARVRRIYPNFNIGESTGQQNDPANRWKHPYRHWKFVPSNVEFDWSKTKP